MIIRHNMWVRQDVKHIFYSGSFTGHADEQLIVDICYLLNARLLFAHKKCVATRQDYSTAINTITTNKRLVADIAGGGTGHMALKLIAEQYLKTQGYRDVLFEQEFEGFRPDVLIKDRTVLAECGNVEPNKIFSYFKNKKVKQLVILPYPDPDEDKVHVHIFSPSSELADFLCFKEEENVRNVQKIFAAAHRQK